MLNQPETKSLFGPSKLKTRVVFDLTLLKLIPFGDNDVIIRDCSLVSYSQMGCPNYPESRSATPTATSVAVVNAMFVTSTCLIPMVGARI